MGVICIQARSLRYSDTAVCLFRVMYGLGVDCLVPPGDSSGSSSHTSPAARRAASSNESSAVGVSGIGPDAENCADTGGGAYGFV